ncbi:MAG TPA: hypothetical protein VNS02_09715, partial [Rhizobiaceae bacterium]|nr:hypothetical protein [Rhizobiaceae bacterium]
SLMTCSAGAFPVPDFCLIFAPLKGYDEPKILRSQLSRFGPISADAGHAGRRTVDDSYLEFFGANDNLGANLRLYGDNHATYPRGIALDASRMSFFDKTPIARPTVSAAATDAGTTQTLVNDIRTALINLGLVQ